MKAVIEVEKRYKISIGGIAHGNFQKVSEWEGMAKFQNEKGVVILDVGSPGVFEFLSHMTGKDRDFNEPTEVQIIKLSTDLAGNQADEATE